MITKRPQLTKHIGFRVKESAFDEIERLADSEEQSVGDWCRDRLLGLVAQPAISSSERLLLAEIAATQNITISLLYAYARDGQLPEAKVRETLDRARREKYAQATELLRQAATILGSVAKPAPGNSTTSARRQS